MKNEIPNIMMKYKSSGTAILNTSMGSFTMYSPFKENMTIMVKSSPINAVGPSFFINTLSYQSFPLFFTRTDRVIMPAIKGIPRYMNTALATSHMEMSTTVPAPAPPIHADNTVINTYARTEYNAT